MSLAPYISKVVGVRGSSGIYRIGGANQDALGIRRMRVVPFVAFALFASTGYWLRIVESVSARKIGPVPYVVETLNGVIEAGVILGLWPGATPTTLNEVIDSGIFLFTSTSPTLNQVLAAGRAQGYWL